jgi:hypothetical protein
MPVSELLDERPIYPNRMPLSRTGGSMNPPSTNPSSSCANAVNDVKAVLSPGDEAVPGTPGTGEDLCLNCNGTGKLADGKECPTCSGTGKVTRAIGGG